MEIVYGNMSRNAPSNRSWEQVGIDTPLMGYNSSLGILTPGSFICLTPHNETALNNTLTMLLSTLFEYSKWTSGPHGLDGNVEAWNGTETGDLNKPKIAASFNEEGVLEFWRQYRGTGTGWNFTDELMLQTPLKPVLQTPTQSGTNVALTWNAVTNASTYYIYRSVGPITQLSWQGMMSLGQTSVTNFEDQNVANGTYYYAVVAGNAISNNSISINQQITVTSSGISGFHPLILIASFAVIVMI
ncbi:MAG: hypothetical protein RBG13Loki_1602 [Promethearchaeota archaeon CR_4]|nr:MAG: hypothetical protein RBG13Loki_1602 [Candidatus Lokiarchaeota archaeon CR_4]